jgi:hypothetical protein
MSDILVEMNKNKDKKESVQVTKAKYVPTWVGTDFERWKTDVLAWDKNNKDEHYAKCQDLIESLKKNSSIRSHVLDVVLDGMKEQGNKMVVKVLELLSEKYSKTMVEKSKEVFDKVVNFHMKDGKTCEEYWDRFHALIKEIEMVDIRAKFMYAFGILFVEEAARKGTINPEETQLLKSCMEQVSEKDRVPKHDVEAIPSLKNEFKHLKIENNRDLGKAKSADIADTHYGEDRSSDNRSRYEAWKDFRNRPDFDKFRRSYSQKGMRRTASRQYRRAPSGSTLHPPPRRGFSNGRS